MTDQNGSGRRGGAPVAGGLALLPGFGTLVVAAALLAMGCVLPYAVPPSRVDVGGAHVLHGGEGNVFHLAAGVHSAAMGPGVPRSDAVDVGVGYVLDAGQGGLRDQGAYGEASWFFLRSEHRRLSVGSRAELLRSGGETGGGLYARIGGEIFTTGGGAGASEADNGCGTNFFRWRGVPGTGFYAEAGAQHLPDRRTSYVATAGLSIQLPGIIGFFLVMPDCG